jgi:RHS repeat-associated protein
MLDNLNLTHMNGRVYDQLLGRFLSADPYIDGALNTQSWNRFSYVKNNPLSFTDPSGFRIGIIRERTHPTDYVDTTGPRWTDSIPGWDVGAPDSPNERGEGGPPAADPGPPMPPANGDSMWTGVKPKCPMGGASAIAVTNCQSSIADVMDSMPGMEIVNFLNSRLDAGIAMAAKPVGMVGDYVLDALLQSGSRSKEAVALGLLAAAFDSNNAANTITLGIGFLVRIPGVGPARGIAGSGGRFIVSSSGAVVDEAIVGRWAQGTFRNSADSLEYHFAKHGAGRSLQQYTDDAAGFFETNRGQAEWGKWNQNWQESFRLKVGDRGGYYTADGKILTYWD